jgi:hypothetical protein
MTELLFLSTGPHPFQHKLSLLNLEPIAQTLLYPASGYRWTKLELERAIARYKQFLYLLVLPAGVCLVDSKVPTY